MDYIYGELNVKDINYTGKNSSTANTTVDNIKRTIEVDVTDIPERYIDQINLIGNKVTDAESAINLRALDSEVVHLGTAASPSNETIYGEKTFSKFGGSGSSTYITETSIDGEGITVDGRRSTTGGLVNGKGTVRVYSTGADSGVFVHNHLNSIGLAIDDGDDVIFVKNHNNNFYQYLLPYKSGTVALTDDLTNFVIGPSSATDNAIALFDGTTGKVIKSASNIVIDDSKGIISPTIGSIYSLGSSSKKWGTIHTQSLNLYSNINPNSDYKGLVVPDTTDWIDNKTIATTDDCGTKLYQHTISTSIFPNAIIVVTLSSTPFSSLLDLINNSYEIIYGKIGNQKIVTFFADSEDDYKEKVLLFRTGAASINNLYDNYSLGTFVSDTVTAL